MFRSMYCKENYENSVFYSRGCIDVSIRKEQHLLTCTKYAKIFFDRGTLCVFAFPTIFFIVCREGKKHRRRGSYWVNFLMKTNNFPI